MTETPTKPPSVIEPPPGTPVIPDCVLPTAPLSGARELWAHSLLGKFLIVSLAAHIFAISTVTFTKPLRKALDLHQTMDVVLVNSATKAKPTKAEVLAQAHLDGGGNVDENRQASTHFPKLPEQTPQTQLAAEKKKREDLEKQVQKMLAQQDAIERVAVSQPEPKPELSDVEQPSATRLMNRTLELIQLEAQIKEEFDAYQKRPRKLFIGSRAEEYRFARYIEDWRLKVERIGNLNYPEIARREKIYGSLIMTVSIKSDGSVYDVEIARSSGHRILDAAAVRIVDMAAPYAEFPADIRRDVDVICITRAWSFTRDSALETRYAPR
ncbi:MAG: TonB family protein [Burkholderiales bacterium]|nr:TonB family protein [Burkholderiales bacterium]